MSIKVFRDEDANAAVMEVGTDGAGGMRFNKELLAVGNGDGTITVLSPARGTDEDDFAEVSSVPFADFYDEQQNPLGSDEAGVVNALNAIMSHTGSADPVAPVITSATAVTITEGDAINYDMVATGGVGFEWSGIPEGMAIKNGSPRKLIGTPSGGVGTYNLTMTATNLYGSDTQTLVVTVEAAPFGNTRSINFENQQWMGGNAGAVESILGSSGNGSGASDAWTIHAWFKGSSANQGQVLMYFGNSDMTNGGYIQLMQVNSNGNKLLRLRYGSGNNNLRMQTPAGSILPGVWQHVLVCYDGGTTGSSSSDMDDYWSRFRIYINGTLQVTNNSHSNFGGTGSVDGDLFRRGRQSGNYMRSARLDEVAIWAGDQSSNISDIYNGGSTHDLTLMTTPPDHWWRMGDGDTYPNIQDNIGFAHFVMYNMTAENIVTDVP